MCARTRERNPSLSPSAARPMDSKGTDADVDFVATDLSAAVALELEKIVVLTRRPRQRKSDSILLHKSKLYLMHKSKLLPRPLYQRHARV